MKQEKPCDRRTDDLVWGPSPYYSVRQVTTESVELVYTRGRRLQRLLNGPAALVWQLCDGRRTEAQIIALLSDGFPDSGDAISHNVRQILAQLAQLRIITRRVTPIDRLIVFAGVGDVGKSTLLERLRGSRLPNVAETIGIENPATWCYLENREVEALRAPLPHQFILHLILRWPAVDYAMRHVIPNATAVSFVTVWAPAHVVSRRKREMGKELYQVDAAEHAAAYERWLRFTTERNAKANVTIVNAEGEEAERECRERLVKDRPIAILAVG